MTLGVARSEGLELRRGVGRLPRSVEGLCKPFAERQRSERAGGVASGVGVRVGKEEGFRG